MNKEAASAPPFRPERPVSRSNLREQVTSRILSAIVQGVFRSGERLVVQRLAGLYEVSPTPVREALVELAGLGMVELLPNRGAVVLSFGPRQVREISQVRRVLEVEAVRCACDRIDPVKLALLETDLVRLQTVPLDERWDRAARVADSSLHLMIASSCGSARLTAEIHRYLTLIQAIRDVSHLRDALTHYSRTNDVSEHLAILAPLQAGDAEGAARAMDRHIRCAAKALDEVLFQGGVDPMMPGGDGSAVEESAEEKGSRV
jgi:DNA-binding GntR family transcriptional regulator